MIDIIKAIIFGIVEGITEWLPISSTGHLIIMDEFIKMNTTAEFKELFLVFIQLGAILAVVILYFKKLNPFSFSKTKEEKKSTFVLWFKVLVACIPAGVIGILFNDLIDELFYNYLVVALMLIVYGVLYIIIESKDKKPIVTDLSTITYKAALYIGMFQVLALIPGTSRSGATIIGAIIIGLSREVAAEFTFFLAIPVMIGASLLKILKFGFVFTSMEIVILLTGFVVAFITSIIAIKLLMNYIKNHNFKVFGYYRVILGLLVIFIFNIL